MDDKLKPADPSDVAGSIAFALRFNRRKRFHEGDKKRFHEGDKLMADITADHIVRHLDNSGFVIMKKPPAGGAGSNPGAKSPGY
jgi:hypothetical protein